MWSLIIIEIKFSSLNASLHAYDPNSLQIFSKKTNKWAFLLFQTNNSFARTRHDVDPWPSRCDPHRIVLSSPRAKEALLDHYWNLMNPIHRFFMKTHPAQLNTRCEPYISMRPQPGLSASAPHDLRSREFMSRRPSTPLSPNVDTQDAIRVWLLLVSAFHT
jgi:hypothetical protein